MKLTIGLTCVAALIPATAIAENTKSAAPKTDAKIEMPKPAPELAALVKARAGTWTCKGKAWMPDGSEHTMTGRLTAKTDLNGFWLHESWDGQLDKIGFKQDAYTTYDGKAKQWRRVVVDSLGGQMTGTSAGLVDNKLDFALDTTGLLGPMILKEHLDMTDPQATKISTERSVDSGQAWQRDYAIVCAKG